MREGRTFGDCDDDMSARTILWTLEKEERLLRCELRELPSAPAAWELRVFEDGELAFTHVWPLESSARFVAASLRRERLRDGWCELSPASGASGRSPLPKDVLAFVARSNCAYALELMFNLNDALNVLGWPIEYQFVNIDVRPATDAVRGYPSPTLLWKGKEIFGLPVPTPPLQSC